MPQDESMLVVLKKHDNFVNFVISSRKPIIATNDLRVFSTVNDSGQISLLSLNGARYTLGDVYANSFQWQENLPPNQYALLVVEESGLWSLYHAAIVGKKLSVQLRSSWNFCDAHFENVDSDQQTEILRFYGNEGIFISSNGEILRVVLQEGLLPESKLSFRISDSQTKCVKCCSERLYTLHNDFICAYDLKDGTKCLQWNLQIKDPVQFWISPDAKTFLVHGTKKLCFMKSRCRDPSVKTMNHQMSGKPVISAFVKQLKDRRQTTVEKSNADHTFHLEGASVHTLVMCANHAFCLLAYDSYKELKVFELDSGKVVASERLVNNSSLAASNDTSNLPLILSEYHLMIFLLGNSPNKLVNELMVYTGGTVLHNLAYLNKWQDITVDFEVFEIGLRNRQLNTISFFLNGKLEEFRLFWKRLDEETVSFELVRTFLHELTVMLGLLSHSLDSHFGGVTTSLHFAEQLLRVALQTVLKLMSQVMIDLPFPRFFPVNEVVHPSNLLTQNLMMMRQYLVGHPLEVVPIPEMSFTSPIIDRWLSHSFSFEEIVQDAVLHGCIPLAQWHIVSHHSKILVSDIQRIGMSYAEALLTTGRFDDARSVMENLNLDFNLELLRMARTTAKRELRVLLLSEISHLLSNEDHEASRFLAFVETLFPSSNFEVALNSRTGKLKSLDSTECISASEETVYYCQLSLDLVKSWDVEIRNQILAPAFIQGKCYDSQPPASTVWTYLLQHGDLDRLLAWVHIFYEKQAGTGFPHDWQIDLSMVNSIRGSTVQHVEDALLDEIAKYGIICEDELEDINLLLRRLGRAGCSLGAVFERQGSSLSLANFNHRIVHYCLEHNLLRFLYHFLSTSGRYLHCLPCPICNSPLLISVLSFCHWFNKPEDESLMLQAILSNGQLTYSLSSPTIQEMCLHAPPLLTAATALFSNELPSELELALGQNALLQDAFAASPDSPTDVTVYHLLHGNAPFDPSRMFGWQTTNTLKNEDVPSLLPHFSLSSLVQKYGLHQKLDFTYYLIEGRPNFAYLKFVSQELLTTGNLCSVRIKDVCLEAILLAISNFASPKIATACILFIELLGQSSLSLRIDLQVASLLQAHQLALPIDIVLQLQSCQENCHSSQKVAALLSSAFLHVKRNDTTNILKCSDLRSWLLLVYFCQLHGIEVDTSFLKIYARKNDWLAFFVLAQIFQISREQLLRIVPEFASECLVEHLTHFLQTKRSRGRCERKTEVSKDLRSILYTRIGLKKGLPASPQSSSVSLEALSDEDRVSVSSEEGFPSLADEDDGKDNLLELLFSAFKSESSGDFLLKVSCIRKNPILALIASSFTDAPLVSCMCTWIMATVADESSPCGHSWTQKDLERLLLELVAQNYYRHLHRLFLLFMPESFLLHLSEFLYIFWIEKRYQASLAVLHGIKRENISAEESWLQDLATKILQGSLSSASVVTYEAKIFVKHLASIDNLNLTDLQNFKKLNELLQCLGDGDVELPMKDLLQPLGSESFLKGTWKVICNLQQAKMFRNASRFGQVAQLNRDQVLLSQLTVEAVNICTEESRKKFWDHCSDIMNKENVSPENVAKFFQEWCSKVESYEEKFFLSHLSFCWLRESQCEMDMWLFCIKAETELNDASGLLEAMKDKDFNEWEFYSEPTPWVPPHVILNSQAESLALSRLVHSLLNTGHFGQASRLASIFQHHSLDIDIISICLKLARRQINVSDVDMTFLKERTSERKKIAGIPTGNDQVLNIMTQFFDLIIHGKPVCNKIIVHYSTAQFLGWTYDQVAKQRDSLPLLEELLTSVRPEKYDLAKRLIAVRYIPNRDLVSFLTTKISQSLRVLLGLTTQQSVVDVQDFGFHLLLGLCEDPSMLGKTILSDAHMDGDDLNEKELALVVEMHIRAHDCFTASSNTEGIARVLRKARKLTLQLTSTQNFHLMVRLLTGVGRYSEMTYIFNILHKNSAFELLLKRGMEKIPLLRLALLNYLKHQHASNTEIHSMLALKFGMFREVAEILESSSMDKLKNLQKDCGKQALEIIAQDLGAAAKSYKQAGCFHRAQSCARRANLVSLQLTLLSTGIWVLGLEGEAINRFIVEWKTFQQAFVVAEAYQENQAWDMALYANVVQKANWDYLRDFRTHLGLNTPLIESVAKRFCLDKASGHAQNMKQLLNLCIDVEAKYRLARQLGFDDIVQDLLRGDAGAYLQDLAAKCLI